MKVYSSPIPLAPPDWSAPGGFAEKLKAIEAAEATHLEATRQWLKDHGYAGPNSGKLVRFPAADGYAQYLLAEGRSSFLIHLPYGDGYQYGDVKFLPKREILKRIEQQERAETLFSKRAA